MSDTAVSSEVIEVMVSAEQRVFYKRVCRMSKSDFDRYEAMCDEGASDRDIDRAFEGWVDTTDIYDSNDIRDVTIEVVSPQATGLDHD